MSLHKPTNKWVAQICFKGKGYNLGYFDNPEDASIAYKQAASKLHSKYKIHTVIALSLVIGAVTAKFFDLFWGVAVGALSYWLFSENNNLTEKDNKFII